MAQDATDEEDDDLRDELLAILLLLMLMRGSKVYNNGLTMALSSGLDISKTSKFTTAITAADTTYMSGVVKSFNSDTSAEITKLIAAAVSSGATSVEIKRQLADLKAQQASRVYRFAGNESWRASETAGLLAMTQLDTELNLVQSVGTYKTWNIQAGACPICLDYAGQSVKVKEQFFGGVNAPPVHVTCRCMLSYSILKPNSTSQMEIHCSSCDRFLGITDKQSVTDKLKCSNSRCRTLATPTVRAAIPAST